MKACLLLLAALLLASLEAQAAEPVACPMIAKLCPDGSSVSPEGPHCEMPPCPNGGDKELQAPQPDPADAGDCDGYDCQTQKSAPNNTSGVPKP